MALVVGGNETQPAGDFVLNSGACINANGQADTVEKELQ